ncbi:SPW repeat domain-containing protein [Gymnodinialimonas hymeniacidonis]|uniref:SPW repeat domain-containing protein n=1 Tax=Gymnodinialimonas hymeniacidonis TaxID=3126508 RepID=UPI0034C6C957
MRFITKSLHAYLDYPVALGLIIMPFILGIGSINPVALYLSVTTGAAAFLLTLLTDHQFGLLRVLPYKLHLAVDGAVGLVFVSAPFIFGFTGIEAAYYWVLGATVLAVVALHKPDDATVAA